MCPQLGTRISKLLSYMIRSASCSHISLGPVFKSMSRIRQILDMGALDGFTTPLPRRPMRFSTRSLRIVASGFRAGVSLMSTFIGCAEPDRSQAAA